MFAVKRIFRHWLPIAALATVACLLVFLAAQQVLRMNANDPQIQMVEDAAVVLAQGAKPESVLPAATVDVGNSLAPFMIVYDAAGNALASSGQLHGKTPALPDGVFAYTHQKGEDRVTWQPEANVRIAAVVTAFSGTQSGFVLAGRSLRESESRADQIESIAGLAWLASLVVTLAAVALSEVLLAEGKRSF
jgi:hypothetical protein